MYDGQEAVVMQQAVHGHDLQVGQPPSHFPLPLPHHTTLPLLVHRKQQFGNCPGAAVVPNEPEGISAVRIELPRAIKVMQSTQPMISCPF